MILRASLLLGLVVPLAACGGQVVPTESTPDDTGSVTTIGDAITSGDDGGIVIGPDDATTNPTDAFVGPSDASPVPDAPGPGLDAPAPADGSAHGKIPCGPTATCDAATQFCCAQPGTGGGGGTATCQDIGTTCAGVDLSCSSSANCAAGDECCVSRDPTGTASATCTAGGCGANSLELCQTDADCPVGDRCVRAIGPYRICRPNGGPPPPADAGPGPGADAG